MPVFQHQGHYLLISVSLAWQTVCLPYLEQPTAIKCFEQGMICLAITFERITPVVNLVAKLESRTTKVIVISYRGLL